MSVSYGNRCPFAIYYDYTVASGYCDYSEPQRVKRQKGKKTYYRDIQIVTDVSHICGRRDLLQEVAQQALNFGTIGFMIESHCNPEKALTDANQQITPESLHNALNNLIIRDTKVGQDDVILQNLRKEIDVIDDELLNLIAKRMNVSEKIGEFKKEHKMTVLQMDRWKKVLEGNINKGVSLGLDEDSVKEIFEIIHKSSIKRQL